MDIWSSLQLAHLTDIGAYSAIYTQPSLSSTPGIVAVLAPMWWVIHAFGMTVSFSYFALPRPTAWLVLGPYEALLSAPVLFAADAVAVSLGATTSRRMLICAAEVYALYNVVDWGHPEDAIAVACLLYACLAVMQKRWSRCAWLIGAGVAFQPVVLLALPVLLFGVAWRRWPGLLARIAAPAVALLAFPLALDWRATVQAFIRQVTYPSLNRPTPWLRFAPSLGHNGFAGTSQPVVVGDGPSRLLAVLFALILGLLFRRAAQRLGPLIAVVAVSLSLWCAFETVIAPYYVWPPIAVALIGLSQTGRLGSAATVVFAAVVDLASNADLHAEWVWWVIVVTLGALLVASWPRAHARSGVPGTVGPRDPPKVPAAVASSLTTGDCSRGRWTD